MSSEIDDEAKRCCRRKVVEGAGRVQRSRLTVLMSSRDCERRWRRESV
jgi:hypothetical protein